MSVLRVASVLVVSVASSACGARTALPVGDDAGPAPPATIAPGQRIVFEADHRFEGHRTLADRACDGIYVTADGAIHGYDCTAVKPSAARRRPHMTETELLESYGKDESASSMRPARHTAPRRCATR